jgi:Holliday junction DNA helicase RuvA
VAAIAGGDVALVSTVPGIGRKTAERVILELRDKLEGLALPGVAVPREGEVVVSSAAIAALTGLGFRESDARTAVTAALAAIDGDPDVGTLVSAALRHLDTVPA